MSKSRFRGTENLESPVYVPWHIFCHIVSAMLSAVEGNPAEMVVLQIANVGAQVGVHFWWSEFELSLMKLAGSGVPKTGQKVFPG